MSRAPVCLFVTFLAVLGACSVSPPPAAQVRRGIVNGQPAADGQFPEVVALMNLTQGDPTWFFCSGTLISPTVVVSAAHCVVDEMFGHVAFPTDIGIYVGNEAIEVPKAQLTMVSSIHVPSTYPRGDVANPTTGLGRDDDISILVLATPITGVTPAPVLSAADVGALATNTPTLLVGFGVANLDDPEGSAGDKYYGTTPIISRTDWEILIGAVGWPDGCSGDSGGPAFLVVGESRVLFGITSRAADNATAECGEGGIWTLITGFEDWIASALGADGGLPTWDGGLPDGSPASWDASTPTDVGPTDGATGVPDTLPADAAVPASDGNPVGTETGTTTCPASGCSLATAPTPLGGGLTLALMAALAAVAPRRRRHSPYGGHRCRE